MAQASNTRIKVGIVGGTGYTGVELLRLLSQHPDVELTAITSRKEDGLPVADMYPNLRGRVKIAFSSPEKATLTDCDVVFFATPHGVAMAQAQELIAAGTRVIDLAADFRLQDIPTFERWYKIPHTCPDILAESQYGLVGTEPRSHLQGPRHRQSRLLSHHRAAGSCPAARRRQATGRCANPDRRLQVGRVGRGPQSRSQLALL